MSDTTSRLAIPFPESTDAADVPADIEALADRLDLIAAYDLQGTLASRPAAGVRGRYFFATDTGQLFRDGGTVWAEVAMGPSGLLKLALAAGLNRKINFGQSDNFPGFGAVGDESSLSIAHGLGVNPAFAMAIQSFGGHFSYGVRITCHISGTSSSSIGVLGRCTAQPIAPLVTANCFWIAIG